MSNKKSEEYVKGENDGFWKGVLSTLAGVGTLITAIIAGSKTLGK